MPVAVGTSLVVIAMKSFAGFAGHLSSVQIDWRLAGLVTAAAVSACWSAAGSSGWSTRPHCAGVRVVRPAMASVILAEEAHPAIGAVAAGLTVLAAGMLFACTRYAHCPMRRLMDRPRVGAAV